MLTLKKLGTTYVMKNLRHCVPNKGTYNQSVVLKDEEIFQHDRKKVIGEGLNTEAMSLKNEDFSDEDQCQCMRT